MGGWVGRRLSWCVGRWLVGLVCGWMCRLVGWYVGLRKSLIADDLASG